MREIASMRMFLLSGALLLANTVPVSAVAPPTRVACDRCEETDRFVRLQTVIADSPSMTSGCCAHPFVLDPEEWQSILSTLRVQRQAEGLPIPAPQGPVIAAFTKDDIAYLSTTLSQAFAQAQPTEWIVFGLGYPTSQGLTELTTGGAYVEGTSLHIVLANFRKVVSMPNTHRLLWERPLRPDSGPAYDLVAGDHQTIVRDPDAGFGLFSSAPTEVSIAYQALLLREPAAVLDSQKTKAATPSPDLSSGSNPAFESSVEERLRILKRLHTQGLITDEDYRTKKQQLLERF